MTLLITLAVLEIVAIVFVVALCLAARRADDKTDRMLSPEEIQARRQTVDVPVLPNISPAAARQAGGRFLSALFSANDTRGPGDRSLF